MKIRRKSVISGLERTREIPVNPDDFQMWKLGILPIEEAMGYLTDEDREFILSGITKEEWKETAKFDTMSGIDIRLYELGEL